MTAREAIAVVKANGIVLESAHGPTANLAELITGEPIRGSWWGIAWRHKYFAVRERSALRRRSWFAAFLKAKGPTCIAVSGRH